MLPLAISENYLKRDFYFQKYLYLWPSTSRKSKLSRIVKKLVTWWLLHGWIYKLMGCPLVRSANWFQIFRYCFAKATHWETLGNMTKTWKSATCIFTNCLDVDELNGQLNSQIWIFLQALSIFLLLHPLPPFSSQSQMVSSIGWHQNSPQSASSNTIWAEAATGLSISVSPSPTAGNEIFTRFLSNGHMLVLLVLLLVLLLLLLLVALVVQLEVILVVLKLVLLVILLVVLQLVLLVILLVVLLLVLLLVEQGS